MLELADIERNPAEHRRLLTFFVAGGGFAGTEVAGELADFLRLLTRREYAATIHDLLGLDVDTASVPVEPRIEGFDNNAASMVVTDRHMDAFLALAIRALPRETNELNLNRVLSYVREGYWRHTAPVARTALAPRLEPVTSI